MSQDFLEELLEKAIQQGAKEYVQQEEIETQENAPFSQKHEETMQNMFRKVGEPKLTWCFVTRKVAIILLASLVIFGGIAITTDAFKKKNNHFEIENHDSNYMNIQFGEEKESSNQSNSYMTEEVAFLYLPEGMKLVNEKAMLHYRFFKFEDGDKKFWIRVNHETDYVANTDIEDTTSKKIIVDEMDIFVREKENIINYFWKDEAYYYEVESSLPREEMVKIIDNLKILKKF